MVKIFNLFIVLAFIGFISCNGKVPDDRVDSHGQTVKTRIKAPKGYHWRIEEPESFGEFLQNLKLEPAGTQILDYKKKPISNQSEHVAIKKDIGSKDLQQCADAVIRLRADYLWEKDKKEKLAYHFTSGDLYEWNDYKNGIRPVLVSNSKVQFEELASFDDSYEGFKKYLEIVFNYAGTISLNKETTKVKQNQEIKTGDILVTPGSPGHAVIIVGSAENESGEKVYLLAEGYTPAQSIHILTNPFNKQLNPWYKLDLTKSPTITARYSFTETNIRAFKD
jgi:hypothetical protein